MVNDKQDDRDFATLLCALSFATGIGFGGHIEHGLRSALLGLQIADALTLASEEREAVFYGALLKDVACTACAAGMAVFLPDEEQVSLWDVALVDPSRLSDLFGWLSKYLRLDVQFFNRICKLLSFMAQCGTIAREMMRSHCEVAELFARKLGFPRHVQHAVHFQWERWDGKGMAYQVKGPNIPRTARILHLAQVLELLYHFSGSEATRAFAREKRGTRFDPEVADTFLMLTQQADFWPTLEEQSTQEAILARRPPTMATYAQGDQTERICETLADLVDLKTRETWHHSRNVAEIAEKMGICLGMNTSELTRLRRAALVHDIGKVAVPVNILTKGEQLSSSEWETLRLHPYHTQRILERVPALQELAPAAAAHHEWVNGQGYHKQLSGEQIPFHGRILAVANTYARLLQQQGDQTNQAEILRQMHSLVDIQFDRACYEALVTSMTSTNGAKSITSKAIKNVENLTEREIEVLVLLTQGHNTPQIARTLSISRKTAEHHLSHIYQKIGVTSRTAAVVYAVQQGIV